MFVSKEVDAVCPFSPGRNCRSAGAFSRAAAFDAQRSARSANVRKPASANEHWAWYGTDKDPKRACKSVSSNATAIWKRSGIWAGGQIGFAMLSNQ
eukprot:4322455-Amphidinium_carterae.1